MISHGFVRFEMRTTIVLLAIAVLTVAVLAACRPRDDATADTESPDTTGANETAAAGDTVAADSASATVSTPRQSPARSRLPVRRAGDTAANSPLPPDDSIRAMRPEMPQVTPEKRPRTWRGLKLPEEMPVRTPVETIKRVEQVPDSVMKGDSTKPPKPDR
jgi:hypothetical protein